MKGITEYGKALFLLSEEEGTTEKAREDLAILRDALLANPAYETLIDTPALPMAEKRKLMDEAFGALDKNTVTVLKMLAEQHMSHYFPAVAETFFSLYDESRGNLRVTAVTAVPMTKKQLDALGAKLNAETGKHIFIENTVSPEILGGVILRYAGVQLDGSVKMRLHEIEKSLRALVV